MLTSMLSRIRHQMEMRGQFPVLSPLLLRKQLGHSPKPPSLVMERLLGPYFVRRGGTVVFSTAHGGRLVTTLRWQCRGTCSPLLVRGLMRPVEISRGLAEHRLFVFSRRRHIGGMVSSSTCIGRSTASRWAYYTCIYLGKVQNTS
jgi:hypothetical protein